MNAHSILLLSSLSVLLALAPMTALRADEFAPMFGGTSLSIHNDTFTWDSATEDGTWHYDTYINGSGQSVVVTGMMYGNLATVGGSDSSGTVDGYLEYGYYSDTAQQGATNSTNYSVNGRQYTTVTSTAYNYVDFDLGQVSTSYTDTYSGDGTFTASWDGYSGSGSISGSETGIIVYGSWYVNENYTTTGIFYVNGHTYETYSSYINYSVDSMSNQVVNDGSSSYSGADGSYSYSWDTMGNWSSSDTGSATYNDTTPSFTLFGNPYYRTSSSWNNTSSYYSTWYSTNQSTDNYTADNGGSLTISSYSDDMGNNSGSISGWDLYAGGFSAPYSSNLGDITWDPRPSPTFAPGQIWVNGMLASWQAGSIDYSGVVLDTYVGGEQGEITIYINGSARDFNLGSGITSVSVNGIDTGTYSIAGQFNVNGWDIENGAPNRDTPFFSAATLWVDGAAYPFSYGYEDTAGNRADIYATSGGRVSIVGNTGDVTTGTVWVNHNGDIHAGSVTFGAGGSFAVAGVNIEVIAPTGGPDAFWVGGTFYLHTAGTYSYASFPTAGYSLELSGTDVTALNVSVTNADGTYTGTFNPAVGGVFMVTQAGQMLPACVASADGTLVPSGTVPDGFPPAVRMLDSFWNYLGEAADDGAAGSTAAYYGNTRTPIYSTDPNAQPPTDYAHRLLKIQVGNSADTATTVTMTNYNDAAASTTGSYLPAARLFQIASGTTDALTMPVFGVDPSHADAIWMVRPTVQNGLPLSFVVRGQSWRLASYDSLSDTATYLGLYTGQSMTLGSADPTSGQRLVTLVDPVYNNGSTTPTEGTLSSVRDSVRLRDGTLALSGNDAGVHVAVQNQDNYQLQTVSADLDVVGNTISFGILQGDASLAAALFEFADVPDDPNTPSTYTATLRSALSRPQAQWEWNRAVGEATQDTLTMMKLDPSHKLSLYNPDDPFSATIKLDPKTDHVSELPKLRLNNQTLDDETSVLTQGLGDSRYLRTTGGTQSIAITGGINVNTDGTNAAVIGQNLQAASGQVVLGRNNTAVADDVFVVGAGTSASQTKNALSVSTSGNTTVAGDLTVTGATTLASAAVAGSPVLTQADAASFATPSSVTGQLATLSSQVASTYATQSDLTATTTQLTNLSSQLASDYVSKSATTLALGSGVTASGTGAVAFGTSTTASGDFAFAQGDRTNAGGSRAVAFGQESGASGQHAFAAGGWSTADGEASIALGLWTYAGQQAAVALGGPNICAKGANSFAAGSWSTAWGDRSASLGYGLWVTQPNQIVLGTWNDSTRSDLPQDLVFVVGNGLEPANPNDKYTPNTNPNQSNAIEVELSGRTTVRNKSYQTDPTAEALNVQGAATVSGSLTVAGSPVLTQASAALSFATQSAVTDQLATLSSQVASDYVSISADSLAMGTSATAAGGAWAFGYNAKAGSNAISMATWAGYNGSGDSSISLGYASNGIGDRSISMGSYNWTYGSDSIALGYLSQTSSNESVAIGRSVVTTRWGQVVLGTYNLYSDPANNDPQPTDDLFIIGNGSSDTDRHNAFVIKRNGDAQLMGSLTASQSSVFQASLTVQGRRDPAANDPETTKIIAKEGQEILVPEQGDISMGEFRSGSLPVAP